MLPLASKYHVAVICLVNDERGPVQAPPVRLEIARKIVARATEHGIPMADLVFDPLVMTVGADSSAAFMARAEGLTAAISNLLAGGQDGDPGGGPAPGARRLQGQGDQGFPQAGKGQTHYQRDKKSAPPRLAYTEGAS
jgi:hypothetical protein